MKLLLNPSGPEHPCELRKKSERLATAHRQGKKYLVLACRSPLEDTEWILASFQSPMAVVPVPGNLPEPAKRKMLDALPPGEWISVDNLPEAGGEAADKPLDAIWAVIFSSGSTGLPKGVALSGRALFRAAEAHGLHNGRHSWLLNLPLFHIGGFSILSRAYFQHTPVALGGPRFHGGEVWDWIQSGKVGGISLVPTSLKRLLAESRATAGRLKVALLGGAPAEPDLVEAARNAGIPIRLTYGLTENCSQVATEKDSGCGLSPLPGVELIHRPSGEIGIRSPFLADGIFQQGVLVSLAKENGYFFTGDSGCINNGVLRIGGRISEMIITGGLNVYPAEIESLMADCPFVQDSAVTSVPDSDWGEKICLAYSGNEVSPDTVKSFLKDRLDPRKVPKEWVNLSSIPRTALGKVARQELKQIVSKKLGI